MNETVRTMEDAADPHGLDGEAELTLLSRDELEEMVRARTEALENVMDTMADLLLTLDPQGRIAMANQAVESLLGYEPSALEGKPIDELLAPPEATDDDAVDRHEEFLTRLLQRGTVTDVELACASTDGRVVPISLSASVMQDADGDVGGIVCVGKDISDRKAAEKKAEFLHSLLRHDIGNKLQIVDGYLSILAEGEFTEREREYLEMCESGVDEALELLEKVRMLNRLEEDETRVVNLSSPIEEAIRRNRDLAESDGFEIAGPDDANVTVQGGLLLKELFANLIENAVKHSDGSRVEITVDERADEAVVAVADDGRGIPDEEKARITDRGYSRSDSAGSGLGTYLARRVAETYGGSLAVEDADLGGARFAVTIPK